MRSFRQWGVVFLAAILPAAMAADSGQDFASGQPDTSLTIYTGNFALVRKQIERVLPAGAHTVRIDDLPATIDPASMTVLDAEVTLLGSHGFRSYQDSGAGPGASLDLDIEVEKEVRGLSLAYLTTGVSWSADYSLIVARDDATARLDGFASIVNGSGTSYDETEVQLLAGTVQREGRFGVDDFRFERSVAEMGAAGPGAEEAAFGDYHLYTVSRPLSLRAGESRRIRLLGASSIAMRKEYVFSHQIDYRRPYPEPLTQPAAVSYWVERLGSGDFSETPLPAGRVRLLQEDEEGRAQLLGITAIPNTPAGEGFRLNTGLAFDIVGTRVQTEYERPSSNIYESTWRIELRNGGERDVAVQVLEEFSGDWRIVESTHAPRKLSSRAAKFEVSVPAGGTSVLEYRVSVRT
ncbi:MAG: hypothetical protein JSU87_07450 [Gemmatimonadota bacterium]|nr:MAG: hypothetical protein JSU87_07450 [Gemmatimonadota bacterium]